jgi:formyl-CoA transferase
MVTDPQFIARQMLEQHQFKDGSPITMPDITPKFSETPGSTRWLGPELGEHNHEVLHALGYTDTEIAELKNNGVI